MPKISTPLAKSIRTGEGILVYASSVLLVLVAILPHGMTWQRSTLYLTILDGVHLLARSGLKMAAINAGLGLGAPIVPDPTFGGKTADQVIAEIQTVLTSVEQAQLSPGTPADKVAVGLSPSTVQA